MELEPDGIVPPDVEITAGRDPVLLEIELMLDEGRFDDALEAIHGALAGGQSSALDLTFLLGDTYLSLGRASEAEQQFRAVLAQDPDCPSSRCWFAMSLFLQWRFDEAEVAAQAARELSDAIVDAHVVYGAVVERKGRLDEAEACFELAATLAPEKYPRPVRLERAEFDREVRRAARKLPRQFRQCLDRVPVVVQDLPDESLADKSGDRDDVGPDILGLFDGVPLPETSELHASQVRPSTIYLFQRNIERAAVDREDLVEQIRITLWHELGHYLGFEEEDMDDLGLA
jgi:predicted Zn-dependent protease with MMP-like domain